MISAQTAVRLGRYVLTGGTAALVDLSVFTALHLAGASVPLAASLSFIVAAVVNYTLCSIFVFGHPLSLRQLGLFVAVALLGMAINVGVTLAAVAVLPFGAMLAWAERVAGLPSGLLAPYAATCGKVCGIGVAFLFNFYLNSTVVFRDRGEARRPATAG